MIWAVIVTRGGREIVSLIGHGAPPALGRDDLRIIEATDDMEMCMERQPDGAWKFPAGYRRLRGGRISAKSREPRLRIP